MNTGAYGERVGLLGRALDNSNVVRQVDPRTSRELWALVGLVAAVVFGLVLYAWPQLELRQTAQTTQQLAREKERLLEENRKLRLEKASLEDLRRIEAIATRELGLVVPPPERTIVVEPASALPSEARVVRRDTPENRP